MADDDPVLVRIRVADIVRCWQPGSGGDGWTWADEVADLTDDPVTAAVRRRIDADGFGFHDHIAPILLGNDGRVWDGHHRIIIALERDVEFVMAELTIPVAV